MAWFLSPSGWPTHADSTEEAAELASRGYASLAESAVPAAVAAYQAAQGAPPPSSLPGYALAADVAAALALKANAATVGGKLNTTDLPVKMAEVQADTASAFSVQLEAAFDAWGGEGGSAAAIVGTSPAVRLDMLPASLDQTEAYNTVPSAQSSVLTSPDGTQQFAAFTGYDRQPWVAVRTLPDGKWSTFPIALIPGNPLQAPTTADGHNSYNLGIDGQGYLHLVGNSHNTALQMAKSTTTVGPGFDITKWAAEVVAGAPTSLTYPKFVRFADGTLVLGLRSGSAGNGKYFLLRLDPNSSTWTNLGSIIDGTVNNPVLSPYPNRIVVSPVDQSLWISGCWRDGGTAAGNHDVWCLKSTDKGATWRNPVTNAVLSLPVTKATMPTAVDTADGGVGLLNGNGMGIDTDGRPHIAVFFYDSGVNGRTNIHHIWLDDAQTWHNDTITDLTHRADADAGSYSNTLSQPQVICDRSQGRTFVIYRSFYDRRGELLLQDVTPGGARLPTQVIANLDLHQWNGSLDDGAADQGKLALMVGPSLAAAQLESMGNVSNFERMWGAVLTVDLERVEHLSAGIVRAPQITPIVAASSVNVSTTSTTDVSLGASPALIHAGLRHKQLFARAHIRASATVSATVKITQEVVAQGAARDLATMTVTASSPVDYWTPWEAIDQSVGTWTDAGGAIRLRGNLSAAGTLTVESATIEVGVMEAANPVQPINAVRHRVSTAPAALTAISGLMFYFAADEALTEVDADPLDTWADSSGNDRPALTMAATRRPTKRLAGVSGRPSVQFDGTNHAMQVSQEQRFGWNYTIFAVVQRVGGSGTQVVVAADSQSQRVFQLAVGDTAVSATTFTDQATAVADTQSAAATSLMLAELQRTTTTIEAVVNGVSDGATAVASATYSPPIRLSLGARQTTTGYSSFFNGHVRKVVIYNRALSSSERDTVRQLLATADGITLGATGGGGGGGDITAPTSPTGLTATGGEGTAALSWTASTDDTAVTGYRVYRDGSLVGSPTGTSYSDTGVPAGSRSYTVTAVDAASNESAPSTAAIATVTGAPSYVVRDTFTGTSGALISDRTGEVGATWAKGAGVTGGVMAISDAGRARPNATTSVIYLPSGTPASANYTVSADLRYFSSVTNATSGIGARVESAVNTGYFLRYLVASGLWRLDKVVGGTTTTLGSVAATLVAGTTYHLVLTVNGSTITGTVDGATIGSVTDTAITATGKPAIFSNGGGTDSTGMHLDDFLVPA